MQTLLSKAPQLSLEDSCGFHTKCKGTAAGRLAELYLFMEQEMNRVTFSTLLQCTIEGFLRQKQVISQVFQ